MNYTSYARDEQMQLTEYISAVFVELSAHRLFFYQPGGSMRGVYELEYFQEPMNCVEWLSDSLKLPSYLGNIHQLLKKTWNIKICGTEYLMKGHKKRNASFTVQF